MQQRYTRRGATRSEVLTAVVAVTVMTQIVILAVARQDQAPQDTSQHARTLRDSQQLKQIHQAMFIFAREFNGIMPHPGLIDRHPVKIDGIEQNIPGRGEEDLAANTTANLYSSLITQNYFTARLVVSPIERNPNVTVKDDFDYDQYNPIEDIYWDPAFTADLETQSNTSYSHLVLSGQRMKQHWRDTGNARFALLANRGPQDGVPDGRSHTSDPHGGWAGNLVFADNHTELVRTFTPKSQQPLARDDAPASDNLFAMESGPAGDDCILSFTRRFADDGTPRLQHD